MKDFEEKSELMEQSILKNIQELSEFCVYDFKVNNYYDLVDKIILLNNIVATLERKNNKLYKEIKNEIESESEE